MLTFKRILVPVDGSPYSTAALTFAISLAKEHHATLVLCHVLDFDVIPTERSRVRASGPSHAESRAVLRNAENRVKAEGIHREALRRYGRPIAQILECVSQHLIDAIVMGTQGKRGLKRFALGSTTEGVLQGAHVPVFTVHAETHTTAPFVRMLVGFDNSEPSHTAVATAIAMAQRDDSELTLCSVVPIAPTIQGLERYGFDTHSLTDEWESDAEYLIRHALADAQAAGVYHIGRISPIGDPATEILRAANEEDAELIIVGTHAAHGLERLILGSVAASLVQQSAVPVMVVRSVALSTNAQSRLTSAISSGV